MLEKVLEALISLDMLTKFRIGFDRFRQVMIISDRFG